MKWFENLRTGTKLSLSFGFLILILAFVIISSLSTISKLTYTSEELYQKQMRTVDDIMKMDDDNNNIQLNLLTAISEINKVDRENRLQKILQFLTEQDGRQKEILASVTEDPVFQKMMDNFISIKEAAKKTREEQFMPAIHADNIELAKKLLLGEMADQFQRMSDIADDVVKYARDKANAAVTDAGQEAKKAMTSFAILGAIAFVLSILIIIALNRIISNPLYEISQLAKQVADGKLNIPHITSAGRKDEVGELGDAFKTMIANLNKMTKEIIEVINFLTSSSSEIASTSSELSASSSETATSISETTTTIEEVKQTSQVANKKAKHVYETAQKTSEISETGKIAAEEINNVITEINNQMTLIAETMMRLNEQSQSVGAIISTVEDLAQQTNLLAVNASIEASKAGEQGKGFSVVAQEVKSLANQSKQATSQVRAILGDIQKATSAAVMATELGSKAVEVGIKKANEAGTTILNLAKTVNESSQAASQIAAVSHQQLIGMEQATTAMENIKTASNQNVEGAKVLKESVANIKVLSERLKQLVNQFQI